MSPRVVRGPGSWRASSWSTAPVVSTAWRSRSEGPGGLRESSLELGAGWYLDGADVRCPELMANHLLSMADSLLGEAA